MKRGVVVGELWATRKAEGLVGSRLKLVALLPGRSSVEPPPNRSAPSTSPDLPELPNLPALGAASLVVAVDTLDARDGQQVLVAFGSGARNVLMPGPHNRHVLCDAAVALLIDGDADDRTEPTNDPTSDPASDPDAYPVLKDPAGRVGQTGAT